MNEQPSNSKKYLLSIGIILLIVGIILFVYSFTFFGAFGRSNSFEEASANSMTWFGFAAIGGLLLFLGVVLINCDWEYCVV